MSAGSKNLVYGLALVTVACVAGSAGAWPGHFGHGHRGYGWGGGYGWSGCGNWGYSSVSYFRPSFRLGFAPYRSFYSTSFGFPSYSSGYSSCYPTFRASYYVPAWYGCYLPRRVVTYSLPTCYVAPPVCTYPTYNVSSYYSYPLCSTATGVSVGSDDLFSSSAPLASTGGDAGPAAWSTNDSILSRLAGAYPNGSSYRIPAPDVSNPAFAESERVAVEAKSRRKEVRAPIAGLSTTTSPSKKVERPESVKLVSSGSHSVYAAETPRELLEAADSIFAAGGFRDAAQAYARLSVRYGVDDELTTRRFVALIATGDFEQAAVVMESSAAAKVSIDATKLPGGSLVRLYESQADKIVMHSNSLAQYALLHSDEALPLVMVGTWLTMDGQADRGRIFFERAAQLSVVPDIDSSPLFVSARVTR